MYNLISILFKYVFIIIIYLFIFSIIRLIYLDIKSISPVALEASAYLKLINRRDSIPYKIEEYYSIDGELIIGRRSDNDVYLNDPFVSKKHLKIVEDEGEYYLEDLDSANGTFINKEKVEDVVKLSNGDIIRVGSIEFLFVDRG
ncbi:MAG: FHA domain-containing protein [Tissierellia bacterium]|mgnify:CR=1 FL=1|nr:FHA domain-containing protein [Tissierellia bacterium]